MEKNAAQIDITHCAKKLRLTSERASAETPVRLVTLSAAILLLSATKRQGRFEGDFRARKSRVNAEEEVPMEPRENGERKLERKEGAKRPRREETQASELERSSAWRKGKETPSEDSQFQAALQNVRSVNEKSRARATEERVSTTIERFRAKTCRRALH